MHNMPSPQTVRYVRSKPALSQPRRRLRLEPLEERRLLAVFSAANVGTLITDVGLANSNSDASNTINLAAGSYTLSADGELLIQDTNAAVHTKTLNIIGVSASQTTIDGDGVTRVFEIESAQNATMAVVMKTLAVNDGLATDAGHVGGTAALGGGILIDGGQVTLSAVSMGSNRAVGAAGTAARLASSMVVPELADKTPAAALYILPPVCSRLPTTPEFTTTTRKVALAAMAASAASAAIRPPRARQVLQGNKARAAKISRIRTPRTAAPVEWGTVDPREALEPMPRATPVKGATAAAAALPAAAESMLRADSSASKTRPSFSIRLSQDPEAKGATAPAAACSMAAPEGPAAPVAKEASVAMAAWVGPRVFSLVVMAAVRFVQAPAEWVAEEVMALRERPAARVPTALTVATVAAAATHSAEVSTSRPVRSRCKEALSTSITPGVAQGAMRAPEETAAVEVPAAVEEMVAQGAEVVRPAALSTSAVGMAMRATAATVAMQSTARMETTEVMPATVAPEETVALPRAAVFTSLAARCWSQMPRCQGVLRAPVAVAWEARVEPGVAAAMAAVEVMGARVETEASAAKTTPDPMVVTAAMEATDKMVPKGATAEEAAQGDTAAPAALVAMPTAAHWQSSAATSRSTTSICKITQSSGAQRAEARRAELAAAVAPAAAAGLAARGATAEMEAPKSCIATTTARPAMAVMQQMAAMAAMAAVEDRPASAAVEVEEGMPTAAASTFPADNSLSARLPYIAAICKSAPAAPALRLPWGVQVAMPAALAMVARAAKEDMASPAREPTPRAVRTVATATTETRGTMAPTERGTGFGLDGAAGNAAGSGLYRLGGVVTTSQPATHAAIVTQPPGTVGTNTPFTIEVDAEDANNDVDPTYNGLVIVSLGNNPGDGALTGTLSLNAVNGVATFNNVALTNPGNGYTLNAAAAGISSTTTASFNAVMPPEVAAVLVSGTTWTSAFLNGVKLAGEGNGVGYEIPAGASQAKTLPWPNINQIEIVFNEAVDVTQASLALTGVGGSYATSGFSYNATTFTGTWTIAHAIGADRLNINLASTGTAAVTDTHGIALDGDWTNGAHEYPSGNGTAGGDFNFAFNVLPADANQDGIVNSQDLAIISSSWLGAGPTGDVNADGIVNSQDLALVASQWLAKLPSASPAVAEASSGGSQTAAALATGQSQLAIGATTSASTTSIVAIPDASVVLAIPKLAPPPVATVAVHGVIDDAPPRACSSPVSTTPAPIGTTSDAALSVAELPTPGLTRSPTVERLASFISSASSTTGTTPREESPAAGQSGGPSRALPRLLLGSDHSGAAVDDPDNSVALVAAMADTHCWTIDEDLLDTLVAAHRVSQG